MTSKRIQLRWLVLVLLLAASLRIYHITQQSIWFDEAFAWNIVIQDDMFPRISTDTHPPLYYLVLRGWMTAAGDSPLALRYLSALISMGTVAFIYRVGWELIRKEPELASVPILAALMLTLSDAEIFLAQEARNYSLYTFFACLSMWMYLRWLRRGDRLSGLLWAGGVSALAYTHYQGLFIPAVQGMHVLLFLRGRKRIEGVAWLAVSSLPLLPWFLFVTIPQAKNAIDNSLPFAIPSNWETFLALRDSYLGAMWSLMLILAIVGIGGLLTQVKNWGKAFLIVMWFALPFGVLFFGNFYAALLTERKLLIVAPAIALMVAYGLARLNNPARVLLALALTLYGVSSVDYYRVKEPWDIIAQPALDLGQPGDLYLPQVEVGQYPMKYYWQRNMPEGAFFSSFPFLGDPTMNEITDHPTYYDLYLQNVLLPYNQDNRTGDVATAWVVFWSKDDTLLQRLEAANYHRTMDIVTDHLGNAIHLYRYDFMPDSARGSYQNGMILRAAEIDINHLRVDLWWSAPQEMEYTTSVVILDANGQPIAQKDSPVHVTQNVVYDGKQLDLLTDAPNFDGYQVIVKVYQWTPEAIIDVQTSDDEPWLILTGS